MNTWMQSALASMAIWAGQSGAVFAQPRGYWDDHMIGWGGWWFGPVMMLIVVAVIVLAIIGLWRLFSGPRSDRARGDASLEILRERFARGEIDEEEFEARRRALER
ncbi:MAG: SHOCT domain-containing protein [Dichotomicrobium sp.]